MKKFVLLIIFCCSFAHAKNFFKGTINVDNKFHATFELIDMDTLVLRPEGSQNSCEFVVKRSSLPHLVRGRNGVMFSNKKDACQFIMKKQHGDFWNKIVLIDFIYTYKGTALVGTATLKALHHSFNGIVSFKHSAK